MFGSSAEWYETAREDVEGMYVWQSVILDKETNCNLWDVLLLSDK